MDYTEELRDAIARITTRDDIDWFVDANVMISGEAETLLASTSNVYSCDEVVSEVRKRPSCVRANQFADSVETVSVGGFNSKANFEFVRKCATDLAPAIRVRKGQLIDNEGMSPERAEIRAIEMIASEGDFFECDLKKSAVENGVIDEEQAHIDAGTRRSWYRYPNKRRKSGDGGYIHSDETLVAVATCNALMKGRKTYLCSNDTDCAAIMKQLSDNVLWAASLLDCEISHDLVELEKAVALWESRCQTLNKHRQGRHASEYIRMMEGDEDLKGSVIPVANEIIVLRPQSMHLSHFSFNQPFVDFVNEYDYLRRRCNLMKLGFVMPDEREAG